jgi:hypothetical protein
MKNFVKSLDDLNERVSTCEEAFEFQFTKLKELYLKYKS